MTTPRTRRPRPALPPPGLRRRLSPETRRDLGLVHVANLDALATGTASPQVLWDVLEGVVTWSRVAARLGQGEPEMAAQLALMNALIKRFGTTGQVDLQPDEYDQARAGVLVMDTLAEKIDAYTAGVAAMWSQTETQRMRARYAKEPDDAR